MSFKESIRQANQLTMLLVRGISIQVLEATHCPVIDFKPLESLEFYVALVESMRLRFVGQFFSVFRLAFPALSSRVAWN